MNIGEITTTNSKGQIVIPKKLREALKITTGTTIQLSPKGNGLYLIPVKSILTIEDEENTYVNILKKTAGAWGKVPAQDKLKKDLELKASSRRKIQW